MATTPHIAYGGTFLATRDVPRLAAWYRALGLPMGDEGMCFLANEPGEPVHDRDVIFSIMEAKPGLPDNPHQAVVEEPYGQRRVTLNLRVSSLDDVLAGLKARGQAFAGPRDHGYGKFAWTQDPDGNVVEFWQPAK